MPGCSCRCIGGSKGIMANYRFTLFGRFSAQYGSTSIYELERGKPQELITYLLLNRRQIHHRENLATVFWGDFTTAQSKKYLRQTFWQVQKALDRASDQGPRLLSIQPEWVHFNDEVPLWLDIDAFEQSFNLLKNVHGSLLDREQAQTLKSTIDLYSGQLLQGWYFDW